MFFNSQLAGVYGMRPLESLDLRIPADLNTHKTVFQELIEQGMKELGSTIQAELKNYIKQEVTRIASEEFGKAIGKEMGNVAGNLAGSIMDEMAAAAEQRKAEEAKRQQLAELERIRQQRLSIKIKLREEFLSTLADQKIPIIAPQPETYFFMLNQLSDSTMSVSMFNVFVNSQNQLPYKVDLVKDYQKTVGVTKSWLYGPFKTTQEAQLKLNDIALNAFTGFFDLTHDVYFVHGTGTGANPVIMDAGDFWGTGIKSQQKNTTSDDFWGVKKKNN
jgi:hypothetical protein